MKSKDEPLYSYADIAGFLRKSVAVFLILFSFAGFAVSTRAVQARRLDEMDPVLDSVPAPAAQRPSLRLANPETLSPAETVRGVESLVSVIDWGESAPPHPTVQMTLVRIDSNGIRTDLRKVAVADGTELYRWGDFPAADPLGGRYRYQVALADSVPDGFVSAIDGMDLKFSRSSSTATFIGYVKWIGGEMMYRPRTSLVLLQNGIPYGPVRYIPASLVPGVEQSSVTWNDVPVTDADGSAYVYSVTQPITPEGYAKRENSMIVENIFVEDVISVTGTLIWEGGISPRPAVRVTLQRAGLIEPLTNLYTVTIPDGVTSYTWQNLLKVDPLGNPYSYRMVLAEPLSTYRAEENGLSIMLNYTSELRSLSAKIYWRGGPDAIRPKTSLLLLQNGSLYGGPAVIPESEEPGVTESEATWEDVPVTDEFGVRYDYTVIQPAKPEGYTSSTEGLTVTNTLIPRTVPVTGKVIWIHGQLMRESVGLRLVRRNANGTTEAVSADMLTTVSNQNCTVVNPVTVAPIRALDQPDEITESVTWCVPETDIDGNPYNYFVEEDGGERVLDEETPWASSAGENSASEIVKTFRVLPADPRLTIEWVGGDTALHPALTLELRRNGEAVAPAFHFASDGRSGAGVSAPVSLLSLIPGLTPDDLPASAIDGSEMIYSIHPVEAPENYLLTPDGMKLTAVFQSRKIGVDARLTWIDGETVRSPVFLSLLKVDPATRAARPVDLTEADRIEGSECAAGNPVYMMPPDPDMDSSRQVRWCVDEFAADGSKIQYQIEVEKLTENWEAKAVASDAPLALTLRYNPPPISLSGSVVWVQGEKTFRPPVFLELYRNGTRIGNSILLTAAPGEGTETKFTIDSCYDLQSAPDCGLTATDSTGRPYVYTLNQPSAPKNYRAAQEGMTVTNTYVPPKTGVTGGVTWINGQLKRLPVRVVLMRRAAGGDPERVPIGAEDVIEGKSCAMENPVTLIPVSALTENDQTRISVTWCVDATDSSGEPIEYFLTEAEAETSPYWLPASADSPLQLVKRYRIPAAEPKIIVNWEGGANYVHPEITLALLRNGTQLGSLVTLQSDGLSGTSAGKVIDLIRAFPNAGFSALPETDLEGRPILYSVAEPVPAANYDVSVDGLTITHAFRSDKKIVRVQKVWIDGQYVRQSAELRLQQLDGDGRARDVLLTAADGIDGVSCEAANPLLLNPDPDAVHVNPLTVAVNWCVDEYDSEGNPITYQVVETESDSPLWTESVDESDPFRLLSTYHSRSISPRLLVRWIGGSALPRPEITLELRRNGQRVGALRTVSPDTAFDSDGGAEIAWCDEATGGSADCLDVTETDAVGQPYRYTIHDPNPPANYLVTEDGLTLTYAYQSEKIPVQAELVRFGGQLQRSDASLQLMRTSGNGGAAPVTLTSADRIGGKICAPTNPVMVRPSPQPAGTAKTTETITWCVDRTDGEGVPYQYSVENLTGDDERWNDESDPTEPLRIIERYQTRMITPAFRIVWVGGSALTRPAVQLQLLRDGVPYGEDKMPAGDAPEGIGAAESVMTWTEVPETDANGRAYAYRIRQVEVPEGYQQLQTDNTTITNRYVSKSEDITGEIEWKNGPDPRPTVTVQLMRRAEGGVIESVGSTSFQDGVTTHVWPSLPLTDAEGNLYTYSLMNSVAIANYEASVDGLKAVYTYQSPLGSVQGTIQWENGMKLPRPAVEIQLYCNGEAVGEPRKLEAGTTTGVTNQAVSWSALPLYDDQGVPYEYSIGEPVVPENYRKIEDGLTLLNRYEPPVSDVIGRIAWEGNSTTHPTAVVSLKRSLPDGTNENIDTVEIPNGKLAYVWKNLPMTDEQGGAFGYALVNAEPLVNYSGVPEGLTVTYRYEPVLYQQSGKIDAEIRWIDVPGPHPTVELTLQRSLNDAALNLERVSFPNGVTTYRWTDMIGMTDAGQPYSYQLKVGDLPSEYLVQVDGFVVTIRFRELKPAADSVAMLRKR